MDYYPIHDSQTSANVYAPVESMADSNTGFMTRDFIRRAVFSDGTSAYRSPMEPEPGDTVSIRLRTARGNASAAVLVTSIGRYKMSLAESDSLFDYYTADVNLGSENINYYFIIWCGENYYFYNHIGVAEELNEYYNFKLMPGFKTPDWAKGAVMYQIFTERFRNGSAANGVQDNEYFYIDGHVKQVVNWNQLPAADDTKEFYGGDLVGVRQKLDYLKWLGVEVIYFNPLFVSPSNHKYDTQDYDHIDPHFTGIPRDKGQCLSPDDRDNSHASRYIKRVTDQANLDAANAYFADLVSEAHKRGIRVIIDGVFNHCGSFNKWLDRQGIYEQAEGYGNGAYFHADSPYRSFFRFKEESWPENKSYDGWWGHDTLPKLNYEESPELFEYIMQVARKWVSAPYNCDGWRLDVAADLGFSPEYNHWFWKQFRKTVKEANPEAVIIAENYDGSSAWLQGDEWDTIMNYEAFMEPVTWFLTGMEKHSDSYRADMLGNHEAFFGAMLHHMSGMNTQSLFTAMNQLSNHDHSRFLTRTNRRVGRTGTVGAAAANEGVMPWCMRAAVMIQMTWPGAPCLYYGDEAGLCGWTDPDNRRTYPWGREDKSLLEFHRQLIGLHKAYDCLRTGSLKFLAGEQGIIGFGRFKGNERIVVIVNINDEARNIDIPTWEIGANDNEPMVSLVRSDDSGYYFNADIYRPDKGAIWMHMEPHSAIIMKNLPGYLR